MNLSTYSIRPSGVSPAEWAFRIHCRAMAEGGTAAKTKSLVAQLSERLDHFLNDEGGTATLNLNNDWSRFIDNSTREIWVTEFAGAYGRAGTIILVNGSPPRGYIVTEPGGECVWWGGASAPRRLGIGRPYEDFWRATMDFLDELTGDQRPIVSQTVPGAVEREDA